MTKLLKPLGLDLYMWIYSAHKGSVKTIAIGTFYPDEIEDHMTAAEVLREYMHWKVDIFTL